MPDDELTTALPLLPAAAAAGECERRRGERERLWRRSLERERFARDDLVLDGERFERDDSSRRVRDLERFERDLERLRERERLLRAVGEWRFERERERFLERERERRDERCLERDRRRERERLERERDRFERDLERLERECERRRGERGDRVRLRRERPPTDWLWLLLPPLLPMTVFFMSLLPWCCTWLWCWPSRLL